MLSENRIRELTASAYIAYVVAFIIIPLLLIGLVYLLGEPQNAGLAMSILFAIPLLCIFLAVIGYTLIIGLITRSAALLLLSVILLASISQYKQLLNYLPIALGIFMCLLIFSALCFYKNRRSIVDDNNTVANYENQTRRLTSWAYISFLLAIIGLPLLGKFLHGFYSATQLAPQQTTTQLMMLLTLIVTGYALLLSIIVRSPGLILVAIVTLAYLGINAYIIYSYMHPNISAPGMPFPAGARFPESGLVLYMKRYIKHIWMIGVAVTLICSGNWFYKNWRLKNPARKDSSST